ncbi:MAG: lysylphosphatidylglycerol synthase transmembrane domain-containing protein [Gemmatirosa sp.]
MKASRLSPGARRAVALSAWIVATLLVVLALRAVGWRETLAAASQARLPWLVVASVCHATVVTLWAWQTWLLLPEAVRARFGRIVEVQAITATAQNTIPAFLGQATGVAVLAERGGAGTAAALSVLAQHSLIEALAKLATLAVAAQVAPLPPWMRRAVLVLGVALALLALGLFGAAWLARGRAPRAEDALPPSLAIGLAEEAPAAVVEHRAPGLWPRLRAFVVSWAAALDALRSPRRLALAVVSGLLMKVAEAGGWTAVERTFGVAPRPGSAVLVLAATNLASALPASPGNLGVYEGAALLAYTALGVPRDQALALGIVGHIVYLVPFVGMGWVVLSVGQLRGRRR